MNKIKYTLVLLAIIVGSVNLKAQTNPALWSVVGPLSTTNGVLELNPVGNDLIAGISKTDSLSVGRWNGLFWQTYPGFKVETYNRHFCTLYRDTIFATGNDSGTTNQLHVRKFNGTGWTDIDISLINKASTSDNVGGIATINNTLYLFGGFVDASKNYINILKYSAGTWSVVGPAGKPGVSSGQVINVMPYNGGIILQGNMNIATNDFSVVSRNVQWDGTSWKKFNNYLDSTDILYNDNDTLFYKKDSLIYKYYNGTSTNISNNLMVLGGTTSTFVAVKGTYYYFGSFKLNGASTGGNALVVRKNNSWFYMEQNLNRGGIANFQNQLYCGNTFTIPSPDRKVEMLNPGYSIISGNIFKDVNKNCIKDGAETGLIVQRNITIMPDNLLTMSDNTGNYNAIVTPGTKTVYNSGFQYNKYLFPSPCSSSSKTIVATADSIEKVDFPMYDSITTSDVAVRIHPGGGYRIRKSQNDLVTVDVINVGGNVIPFGVLKLTLDSQLTIASSSPTYNSFAGHIVTWNFSGLQKDEVRRFTLQVHLSSAAILGDSIQYIATVTDSVDNDLSDNIDSVKCRIIYSYDPNNKICYPADVILKNTDKLEYNINFQNTGTSYAINVHVIDTLDTDLPMEKVVISGWSTPSPPKVEVKDHRILVFTFTNIMLPDSFSNEKASHGYINYYCGLYKNLPYGTRISNRAYIYFDYNIAVPTNQTENVRGDNLGIDNRKRIALSSLVSAFPNPANEVLHIQSQSFKINTITVSDINGKLVSRQDTHGLMEYDIDVQSWPDGIYLISLENNDEKVVKKIVIHH